MYLPQNVLDTLIGVGIVIGAIECFFGYRIFKIILALLGFILGAVIAATIGYGISQAEGFSLLAGLVGGFIGAALMVALYFVGVFLTGAFLGCILGAAFYAATGNDPGPAVFLILAVIGGALAVIYQKFMIILCTAFGGAWSVVLGIAYFTTGAMDPVNFERFFRSTGSQVYAVLLCWLALGIVGVLVQYKSVPPAKDLPLKRQPAIAESTKLAP